MYSVSLYALVAAISSGMFLHAGLPLPVTLPGSCWGRHGYRRHSIILPHSRVLSTRLVEACADSMRIRFISKPATPLKPSTIGCNQWGLEGILEVSGLFGVGVLRIAELIPQPHTKRRLA